jgi:hypothetical protein
MPSTIWSFAAPGDRETLTAAGIAWLLDPAGTHGLGDAILDHFCRRAAVPRPSPAAVRVIPEESPSRDRRFDIAIMSGHLRLFVVEVKCKTFGYRTQLIMYQPSATAVVRCSFADWNWPDLSVEDRRTFPLITLDEISQLVLKEVSHPQATATELARHLMNETSFLTLLHRYFIGDDLALPPEPPTSFRYSQRFLNQLYWSWVIQKGKEEHPQVFNDCTSKSERSGVWLIPFSAKVPRGEMKRLSPIDIELRGPLEYWLHAEIFNQMGLLAKPADAVGMLQLRVTGDTDAGQREETLQGVRQQVSRLAVEGWRMPGRTPPPTQGYYSVLTRSLSLVDFRFSRLVGLLRSIVGPD